MPPRAAHFLLHRELAGSPPNEAIIGALRDLGFSVDLFAPDPPPSDSTVAEIVNFHPVAYGKRWLLDNLMSFRWRRYAVFSATSEDPLAIAGTLAKFHRRPFFALVDEIKSGSYRGDAPQYWKSLCQWAIRSARFSIVNDEARVELLRQYANLSPANNVLVYPGSFRTPPLAADRTSLRKRWGIPQSAFTLCVSGGFNETSGADWLFECFKQDTTLHLVIQAVNMPPFTRLLLQNLAGAERLYLEPGRLEWGDAWASAPACDVGLAIYKNPAPQFQNMGISSNRLCMFLAMGVPVIASRQPSFEFIERYDCGRLVSSASEFQLAVEHIRNNLDAMRSNALKCAREYIRAPERWLALRNELAAMLGPVR